jgi:large subunit ribosomal protein L1
VGGNADKISVSAKTTGGMKMSKKSKRFKSILEKIDPLKEYQLDDAIALVKECATAKFDESIELHVKLGVDPRHADQQVRSTVGLPHGTGHDKKVLVIAAGEKLKEAEDAGADFVGGEEKVAEIEGGWLDFDAVIATPDVMKTVGRLGKVLGPRGLMPSAKTNTVTFDVAAAVKEIKAGRVEFRVDKAGIIHNGVGRASFTPEQLTDNVKALLRAIIKARPSAVKGTYLKGISLASTMGAGIKVDAVAIQKDATE